MRHSIIRIKFNSAIKVGYCLIMLAYISVGKSSVAICRSEVRVNLNSLVKFGYCLVIIASFVVIKPSFVVAKGLVIR